MKIIGFSGPPHSGKDSIADELVRILRGRCQAHKRSLAAPMRRVGMSLLGWHSGDNAAYERLKGESQVLFKTQVAGREYYDNLRQFMIWLSEDAIKPRYGKDFWARLLYAEAHALGLEDAIIVIPDLGFSSEVRFFESALGAENFITVQLSREGCDFSIDSRDYVNGDKSMMVDNDSTIQFAAEHILARIKEPFFGWQL